MQFENSLIKASFVKRYKRFFVDAKLENGEIVTAHCANTGKMLTLCNEGALVFLSNKTNPKAKLKYGLEIIEHNNSLVGVNTIKPNHIVKEAIINKQIKELESFDFYKAEVKYGTQNSKIDLLLKNKQNEELYLEIKNVHLIREQGVAEFPDTTTTRGAKHLEELTELAKQNTKACNIFLVQRQDCKSFKIAKDLDENYYKKAKIAKENGVMFLAYNCTVNSKEIKLNKKLNIIW